MKRRWRKNSIGISAVGYYLPSKSVSIGELRRARKIRSQSGALRDFGFNSVRVAQNENSYDMAKKAVSKLFRNSQVTPKDIDAVLYSSALPDTVSGKKPDNPINLFKYPALRLQYEFDMSRALVLGISQAGCVSLFQSIRIASGMLVAEPSLKRVLCVSSDALPANASREILFNLISDGACAALVETGSQSNRVVSYSQVTKGFYWDAAATKDELVASYFPTARFVISDALRKARLTMRDIKLVIPHNVNRKSWDVLSEILSIPSTKLFDSNIGKFGHTIAADAVINLSSALATKRIRKGDYVLLFTFGFGAHWAALVIRH